MDLKTLDRERALLLERLLQADFAGGGELRAQLATALMEPADDDGCLSFRVGSPIHARVGARVPVEAEAVDADGVTIHALLHVDDGQLRELEFFKEDGSRSSRWPSPDEWKVLTAP